MDSHHGKQPVRSYSSKVRDKTARNAESEADPLLPRYDYWSPPPSFHSQPPGSEQRPPSEGCRKCNDYSVSACQTMAGTIIIIFTLFLLPGIIRAWKDDVGNPQSPIPIQPFPTSPPSEPSHPPRKPSHPPKEPPHPPPPPQPFEKAGLGGYNVPSPGSVYIITEANSSMALTYDGNEGINLSEYNRDFGTQRWTCHESEGWLGFTVDPGQSTVFLGYSAWPSPPVLRCSARSQQFNEMFVVSKLPQDGFRMLMRDGGGLKPVGRGSGGMLAMVGVSNVWWRFTKV